MKLHSVLHFYKAFHETPILKKCLTHSSIEQLNHCSLELKFKLKLRIITELRIKNVKESKSSPIDRDNSNYLLRDDHQLSNVSARQSGTILKFVARFPFFFTEEITGGIVREPVYVCARAQCEERKHGKII